MKEKQNIKCKSKIRKKYESSIADLKNKINEQKSILDKMKDNKLNDSEKKKNKNNDLEKKLQI